MTVVATAGHVDHGKSTLVRALTGTDPDRLEEEKRRGLTIDLGFANLDLGNGETLSLIDVPGHIRFLRNMLAGVGAVEGALFVVAATEGWKPQSEEHLRILDLLGVRHAVIALTKVDLVDEDLLTLAQLEIAEQTAGSFAESSPVIPVSSVTGSGIDDLRAALANLATEMGASRDRQTPRLWVDRCFAPAGAGTVVTGTLVDGPLKSGSELIVSPGAKKARVRGLQTHHKDAASVGPGNRVAVNLTGVSHTDIRRGDVITAQNQWHVSAIIDAEIRVLPAVEHAVTRRGAFAAYIGSGEFPARIRVLGGERIEPGERGHIRLYINRGVPALPGDRFILRESGRGETVGGGVFVDVDPLLHASKANPDRSIERIISERGWITADHLSRISGEQRTPNVGNWVVSDEARVELEASLRSKVLAATDSLGLDIALLDERERALLEHVDDLVVQSGRLTIGEPEDPLADHPWLAELEEAPFQPPGPAGIARAEVRELVRRGSVVESEGVFFAKAAIERAAEIFREAFERQPAGITVAEARDLLGTTRKYVLPLLNYFDSNGLTRRREDLRIPGPRL